MTTRKVGAYVHDDGRECDLLVTDATGPAGEWFWKEGPYANACDRPHGEAT